MTANPNAPCALVICLCNKLPHSPKSSVLKNIYYITVSLGEEFRHGLAMCPHSGCHQSVDWSSGHLKDLLLNSLTWLLAGLVAWWPSLLTGCWSEATSSACLAVGLSIGYSQCGNSLHQSEWVRRKKRQCKSQCFVTYDQKCHFLTFAILHSLEVGP